MVTLYRKYRPQKFSDLVGQEYIVQTITNQILLNKIAHAYLFSGPRGTGKTTFARLLAKASNCQNRLPDNFEPCETCSSCQEIAAGRNVDVIEIDAASQTGVDNVRENIIENAQFKPTKSKYKIFIIDEVHMLSTSAFNALLKTLEEPPSHIIFILATTELHKLPATIVSRCQRFNFQKISYELMKQRLEKLCQEEGVTVEKIVLDKIIAKSEGCLRDAESLLGQILALNLNTITEQDIQTILPSSQNEMVLNFLDHLFSKKTTEAFEIVSTLVNQGIQFEQFTLQLIELLRDVLILKYTSTTTHLSINYSSEQIKTIAALAKKIEIPQLVKLVDLALRRKQEIKQHPIPQLPLELLIAEFHSSSNFASSGTTPPPPFSSVAKNSQKTKETIQEKENSPTHTITSSIKSALSHLTGKRDTPTVTIEQIKEKWDLFINTVSLTSHSLTFVLRMCTLEKIDSEGLWIKVPYTFHREKLYEQKNKKLIEQIFEDTFGEKTTLLCEVDTPPETTPTGDTLNQLATEFGGEIIN